MPWGLGHEAVGHVSEIGDAVTALSVGDYVIIPDNADDVHWGPSPPYHSASDLLTMGDCKLTLNSAEYARVSFADNTLIPIPINSTNTEAELDYLMAADVFTTGWHSLSYSGFEAGDSVAISGAGPVGLSAAYSAVLRGAAIVYIVGPVESRLSLARSIGAVTINFSDEDPVAAILALEPDGVVRSLDAVGFEAVNSTGQMHNGIVSEQIVAVTSIYGGLAVAGVHNSGTNSTIGAPLAGSLSAEIPFPMAALWRKGLQLGTGIVLPLLRAPSLLHLIASGKASPSFGVSAEIGIEEAPEYYRRYSDHLESKIVIRFP